MYMLLLGCFFWSFSSSSKSIETLVQNHSLINIRFRMICPFPLTWNILVYVMIGPTSWLARYPMWNKNFECCNFVIFSDTIDVITQYSAWWRYSFSFTWSYHSHWPWPHFKSTAVSNTLNWKFYILNLSQLCWNFQWLLNTSALSWICLSHVFKRDIWHISFEKKKSTLAFNFAWL